MLGSAPPQLLQSRTSSSSVNQTPSGPGPFWFDPPRVNLSHHQPLGISSSVTQRPSAPGSQMYFSILAPQSFNVYPSTGSSAVNQTPSGPGFPCRLPTLNAG